MRAKGMQRMQMISAVAGAAVLTVCGAARAAEVELLSAEMNASPLYDAGGSSWNVTGAPVVNGFVLAGLPFDIAPTSMSSPAGTLVWTGNPLLSDTSAAGVASADFGPTGGGGTFQISGKLFQFGFEVYDGILVEGTLSGFSVEEPTNNFLDLVGSCTLSPTNGALVDGTWASMSTPYLFNFSGARVTQGGSDLTDFSSNVEMVNVVNFNLLPVPEPTTALLLVAGVAAVARKRRA